MPTRTINLKLITGKGKQTAELRRALWTTHCLVNQAVEKIERVLLCCRGRSYWTMNDNDEEIQLSESVVRNEALKMARETQQINGKPDLGSDQAVLKALRDFYEKIIPSCMLDKKGIPLKGDAQASNAFVSPMMDPNSEGGLSVYDKILDPVPKWVSMYKKNELGWENESNNWLQSQDGQRLQKVTGSPPSWVRRLRNGQDWQDAFINDQDKKKKEVDSGNAPIIKKLKELALFPLLEPPMRCLLDLNGKGVNVWDRMAVRLAVAHLLSWESWNHNTLKEHLKAKEKIDELANKFNHLSEQHEKIKQYEKKRHIVLKKVAFADDARPFQIGKRSLRAWDKVREAWLKNGGTEEKRKCILADLQTKLRGKFGDPDLFLWMAKNGNESLWQDEDTLTSLVMINIANRFLEKRKEYSLMTFADTRLHPRWAMYEAPGGSNLRNYHFTINEDRALSVTIPLLIENQDEDKATQEKEFDVMLAPSGQLSDLVLEKKEKKLLLKYTSSHQQFEGVAGGSELLFDRPYLENESRSENELFLQPGSVYFKLTLDVQTKAPQEWLDQKGRIAIPSTIHHFKTALSNKSKHELNLTAGLRVLSVDMGLRTFASCSVFELVQGEPDKGLCFPAEDGRSLDDPKKLWAKHERSFKLTLPGEVITTREDTARKAAWQQVDALHRDINRLKEILRISVANENQCEKVQSFLEAVGNSKDTVLTIELFNGFGDRKFLSTPELWKEHCDLYYKKAEQCVSAVFSKWRRETRPKSKSWDDWRVRRNYHGGKSIWMVDYLEKVRKVITSWNLRGQRYKQVNRMNRRNFGTVASNLLKHINQLKEDRVKAGTDLIIQAARGYIPSPNGVGWEKRYEPCRLVLFEDLARYRFKVDRPRSENSLLMKWNHRQIIDEATLQAELYGIIIETTAAGFSSRYLASSGAPGFRCRHLTDKDFQENGMLTPWAARELEWMLNNSEKSSSTFEDNQRNLSQLLKPGMLVPWSGGEQFASLKPDKTLNVLHADINAAQNLQRRFWSRCGEAFRLGCKTCKTNEGHDAFALEKAPSARVLGALKQMEHGSTSFILVADDQDSRFFVMKSLNKMKLKSISTNQSSTNDEELNDELQEIVATTKKGYETLYRDPSGVFFSAEKWIPGKIYWSVVREKIWEKMKELRPTIIEKEKEDDFNF